ncbi:MAG TPA: alkaline phosphatase family protein [Terriglobia bacterium]|nr:alkaline phosphatase family protein [Terriglobia bacterium]
MLKRLLTVILILFGLIAFLVARPQPVGAPPMVTGRPKLVVAIVIDQLRADYLVRFRPQFVESGFNLVLGGAYFVNCRYNYATTGTGPGHATLFTGAYSNIHGIVGNDWYDRSRRRVVNCVEDPQAKPVPREQSARIAPYGVSPRNLIGSTVGDELRLASDFQSRVVTVALKDRAAILPGGHTANAAFWYDAGAGSFVSSDYYMPSLPAWVTRFNQDSPVRDYCGKAWQALPETPGAGGRVFSSPGADQPCPSDRYLAWLDGTPFMNDIELKFALDAVKNEHLGEDDVTDLLVVGLSVNDYIGHRFGPYSPEVADTTLRTDRSLAAFFAQLDRLVGLKNVWVALSADHGVAPTPAFIKEHRLGPGSMKPGAVKEAVDAALASAYGQGNWVESGSAGWIYLNEEALGRRRVNIATAEALVARAAMSVEGVREAFTRTQLMEGGVPSSPLGRKVSNSFMAARSGNVFVVLEPFTLVGVPETQTTHGSPWDYDAQVPLILWGSSFEPGVYANRCETIDLAPTLAVALGLTQPSGAQGRPLTEALKTH